MFLFQILSSEPIKLNDTNKYNLQSIIIDMYILTQNTAEIEILYTVFHLSTLSTLIIFLLTSYIYTNYLRY